ncbi:response regulator [Spirosoma aerophilum]
MNPLFDAPVWVVDDDDDDLLFLQSAFAHQRSAIGIRLLQDSTALLAQLDACGDLPKLLLLDINMPRLNGLEVLTQLRSLPRYAQLPIIMLTTSTDPGDRQAALSLGANDYLIKPIGQQHLRLIAQTLSQRWALT